MARGKGLDLRVVPTSAWVRSDRRLLRRVLQNLVCQRHQVHPGRQGCARRASARRERQRAGRAIPATAFRRASAPSSSRSSSAWRRRPARCAGLGLGLSIVERIGKVLHHPVAAGVRYRGAARCSRSTCRAPRRGLASQAAEPPAQPAGQLSGLRVVCIDNEPAVLQGMQTLLSGWGCTRHHRARRGRRAGAARARPATAGYHPGRLPPRRGNRDRCHCNVARRHAAADPGRHHYRRSLRRGAAGSPPQGPRPAEKTLEGCGLARPHAPAHLAAPRRGCRIGAATLTAIHQDLTKILPFRSPGVVACGSLSRRYGLIPSEAVDQLSPRELAPSGSGPLISMPLPLILLADRHGDSCTWQSDAQAKAAPSTRAPIAGLRWNAEWRTATRPAGVVSCRMCCPSRAATRSAIARRALSD